MKPQYRTVRKILLLSAIVSVCALNLTPARAQIPDELEKGIANLPPDPRATTAFLAWVNSQPPNQQRDGKVESRYREYLKSRGFSNADVDAQIKLVDERGARAEIE